MDIKKPIEEALKNALDEMGINNAEIELVSPPKMEMGDLAFPCFRLAKILNKSPKEIAEELAKRCRDAKSWISAENVIEKIEAQGPYVNFFYKRDVFVEKAVSEVLKKGKLYGKNSKFKVQNSKFRKKINVDVVSSDDIAKESNPLFEKRGNTLLTSLKKKSTLKREKKIMIEYSSPNTNKPLHLGHGRNNFLGMAVSNLLENAGAKVIRGSVINDRGVHICKSMVVYQLYGKNEKGKYETPKSAGLKGDHFIGKYYVMFGDKVKENPKLEKMAQECLRKWEAGDTEVRKLWEKMNKWYYQGVNDTYKKIGSRFDKKAVYYESETYKYGKKIIMNAVENGIAYKKDDGAIAIDLAKDGLDEKILLRADGTSVYITQDLFTAVKRFNDFNMEELIYVVGNEQNYHFEVLFKILEKLGYDFAKNNRLRHLAYGMVTVPGGKLKSREGTKVDLDNLVAELKDLACKAIYEKHGISPENIKIQEQKNNSEDNQKFEIQNSKFENNIEDRAMKIGLAALKFMILRVGPEKKVFFNPAEAISFEGDTGPYILYAYTRIKSILRKAGGDDSVILNELKRVKDPVVYTSHFGILRPPGARTQNDALGDTLVSDEEMKLAKMIYEFLEVLEKAAKDYDPSRVANFLLDLAGGFNSFYHIHKVIEAETPELKNMRLSLIKSVAIVLERGMNLLGIEMVEEM